MCGSGGWVGLLMGVKEEGGADLGRCCVWRMVHHTSSGELV